ncbi:prolyl oligopeptidase family serine peptidase [Actinoplanes bogorensis]|uniref:Prolyl oligopeptidase family serine peptidase n=1 Tax=Paractinoplanes bogorensis TaxID=1610840 RepID=A0ABS5YXH2_9ACTN|nr:prolyl oligopeptidase family serine peptidase [Actinoplanes bogorensis]MBU2668147.1 prolyl oligopeptidase family serine peptidase [Actinoplanes bogorensis]
MTDKWFTTPRLRTVRPVRGRRTEAALLIEEGRAGTTGRIWPGGEGELLPFEVPLDAELTPDLRHVLMLDDDGGSEVGHLVARPVDGGPAVDLTPDREPYVLRGLDVGAESVLITAVDEAGFHAVLIPAARTVWSSPHEAWYARLSADGRTMCIDSTDHNPGVRRTAVTVVDVATGDTVAVLDDLPTGPVRATRFSPEPGDTRLLVSTERSGYARPAVWNYATGARTDLEPAGVEGELIPLDWHAATGRVLALHVDEGRHRLLVLDERDGRILDVVDEPGAYANPDVADVHDWQWASYFAPDGTLRVLRSRWDQPVQVVGLIDPAPVPPGVRLDSHMVTSADGSKVQVWWARPPGNKKCGTILEIHGGPNLVHVDEYSPTAQAWLDAGFAYAAVNYRGSVTFGRAFREGFWRAGVEPELADVRAALDFLREQGVARPESTFVTGASYGGHMTLQCLGRLPDDFAGGFAHVAMADWASAFDEMNPAVRGVWMTWVGGDAEAIARFSAITYVGQVRGSVWLNQGSRDTRTPGTQIQRYADALAAAGGDVVLHWFDAGHEPTGLDRERADHETMLALTRRTEKRQSWEDS